jgi:hypothetical protein
MKNEGRGSDINTDFKRVYVRVTETTDKTRLFIKTIEPNEYRVDNNTLIYSEEPTHKKGYVNLHMHLCRPEDHLLPKVENVWMLEDTRNVEYISSNLGYKRWGHYKPVRYNPDTMSGKWHKVERFFSTTDPECLELKDFLNKGLESRRIWNINLESPRIRYKIPKEFIKVYAESKGDINYAMVQPFYSSHPPLEPGGERWTSTSYKKDVEGYIAMFPAVSYNKAILKSQFY